MPASTSGDGRPPGGASEKIPIYTVALGTPNGVLPSPDPFAAAGSPSLPTRS